MRWLTNSMYDMPEHFDTMYVPSMNIYNGVPGFHQSSFTKYCGQFQYLIVVMISLAKFKGRTQEAHLLNHVDQCVGPRIRHVVS